MNHGLPSSNLARRRHGQQILASALLTTLLTACSGGSELVSTGAPSIAEANPDVDTNSESVIPVTSVPEGMIGVWDLSIDYGEGDFDVLYMELTGDGALLLHDYEADSFGSQENCYFSFPLVLTKNDVGVLAAYFDPTSLPNFELSLSGDQLNVTEFFVNENNELQRQTFAIDRLEGVRSVDFEACE